MRIAIVGPVEQPVPPKGYGAAERNIHVFATILKSWGHTIHLYVGPDSTCEAADEIVEAPSNRMSAEGANYNNLLDRRGEYDCILDMSSVHLPGQHLMKTVSYMEGDPYKRYPHDEVRNRVYDSRAFAAFNGCPHHPVVNEPGPLDIEEIPLGSGDGGFALFLGPIHRMKGIHLAARACARVGIPLIAFGPIRDDAYWDDIKRIRSLRHGGVVEGAARNRAFCEAGVFVHPTVVCDANPSAPREAMLRGTPVVATPLGGIVEHVWPGVTGAFTGWQDPKAAGKLVETVRNTTDRATVQAVTRWADNPYAATKMLEKLLERAAEGERW